MTTLTGRPPALTADQVRRLWEWHRQRKSAREMAAELGIGISTLHAYLRGQHKHYAKEMA